MSRKGGSLMKRFQPKKNEIYWMINSRWEVKQSINTGSKKFHDRVKAGNSFQHLEEARTFCTNMKLIRNGKGVITKSDLSLIERIKFVIRGRI